MRFFRNLVNQNSNWHMFTVLKIKIQKAYYLTISKIKIQKAISLQV